MTRDDILDAIEQASTTDDAPGFGSISGRMEAVVQLAGKYLDAGQWDAQYLAEAMRDAVDRLRTMLDAVS